VLLLDNLRCGGEYPESVLTLRGIWRLTGLEECSEQLRPLVTCFCQNMFSAICRPPITFVRVLASQLRDSISNLAPHRVVRFLGEASEQLCADRVALGLLEAKEKVLCLPVASLSWF
jgi:hypothetical protein